MKRVAVGLTIIILIIVTIYALAPRKHTTSNDPTIQQIKQNFTKLDPNYGKIPLQEGDSSYTENKEVITLCIKDPETKKYYDMNTLMYVALHELAHMVSKNHGHGDEWRQNFDKLLKEGANAGVYDPRIPIPDKYCGITH